MQYTPQHRFHHYLIFCLKAIWMEEENKLVSGRLRTRPVSVEAA